jgi:hypothetical protein
VTRKYVYLGEKAYVYAMDWLVEGSWKIKELNKYDTMRHASKDRLMHCDRRNFSFALVDALFDDNFKEISDEEELIYVCLAGSTD